MVKTAIKTLFIFLYYYILKGGLQVLKHEHFLTSLLKKKNQQFPDFYKLQNTWNKNVCCTLPMKFSYHELYIHTVKYEKSKKCERNLKLHHANALFSV